MGSDEDQVPTCPECGAKLTSSVARGCIRCGWRKTEPSWDTRKSGLGNSAQSTKGQATTTTEDHVRPEAPTVAQPGKGRGLLLLVLAVALVVVGGMVVMLVGRDTQRNKELQRVQVLYGQLLADAKDAINAKSIQTAVASLQQAVALPDSIDKSEAVRLLKDAKTVAASPDGIVKDLSDSDLALWCKNRTPPAAFEVSYPPLVELYREKIMTACYAEAQRRHALAEAERRKAEAAERERATKEAAARALAKQQAAVGRTAQERGRLTEVPSSPLLRSSVTTDWWQLAGRGGSRASGKVVKCVGDSVVFESSGLSLTRKVDEIEDIHIVAPDADVMLHMAQAGLCYRNGVVAYKAAFFGRNLDPRLGALALDRDLAEATVQVLTLRSRAADLRKTIGATAALRDATERNTARSEKSRVPYREKMAAFRKTLVEAQAELTKTEAETKEKTEVLSDVCTDLFRANALRMNHERP